MYHLPLPCFSMGCVMKYEDTVLPLLDVSNSPAGLQKGPSLVAYLSVFISVKATDSRSGPACIVHLKSADPRPLRTFNMKICVSETSPLQISSPILNFSMHIPMT